MSWPELQEPLAHLPDYLSSHFLLTVAALTVGAAVSLPMAALVIHGVFDRFPNVRVCSIENGSDWVGGLLKKLAKAWRMNVGAFNQDPVESFIEHVWVAPYYEEDVRALADRIGSNRILLGSDFPHAEGLAEPLSFLDDLEGFDAAETRRIMRDNARSLVTPRPPARR